MFFDEGRFGLRSTTLKMWAEKGKPLSVKVRQGFKNFYGYSAVCPFDGENFSLVLPGVNTANFEVYLQELSDSFHALNIVLIMDQAGWHRARALKIPDNIKIRYLPAYSPELNPVEKLWEWLKKECVHNFFYETLDELMDSICIEYRMLEKKDYQKLCNCAYLSSYN
ncbi:MAG: IS630 family transposase [Bacteroidales bacterium]|nr:IS630 family transposase [Bacteroidales bacterium]